MTEAETNMLEPVSLERLATAVRRAIDNAYGSVLIGNAPLVTQRAYRRMSNPQVGDLVIEASTVYRMRHENATDLDGVGFLEKVADEPVTWSDPEFVWDEAVEGQPEPTERCWYIRTFDGRLFRWTNARIIADNTDLPEIIATAIRQGKPGLS